MTLYERIQEALEKQKGTQVTIHFSRDELRDILKVIDDYDQVPPRHCSQQGLDACSRISPPNTYVGRKRL